MQQSQPSAEADLPDFGAFEERLAALEAAVANEGTAQDPEIPRLRQEIGFINKGLLNQTGRVSRLIDRVDAAVTPDGTPIISERLRSELTLINRGLANLTRRINELDDRLDGLDSAATDIARLQMQMSNVDTAFLKVSGKIRQLQDASASTAEQVSAVAQDRPDERVILENIQQQLADLLQAVEN